MATYPKDLGIATAYGYALSKGYTGTEEEFAQLMADYATVGQAAKESAEDSEAWAVGERNGTPVGESDPAYHNNSEYYADAAGLSADNAANSETAAATSQGAAEAWAVGERGGEPVDGGDPTYHNNAKYYAEEAGESATAASRSASDASDSASDARESETAAENSATAADGSKTAAASSATAAGNSATAAGNSATAAATSAGNAEAWAVGQRGGSDVPSSDPTYENNAKYWAEQAAQSAQTLVIDDTLTQPGQAADAKATGDAIRYGTEDGFTAGSAKQLVATVGIDDNVPYNFRTSGGSADIGDREDDTLIGGTIAWNQKIPIPASDVSETQNGVTLTDNRDGTYLLVTDANGATADVSFRIANPITAETGHVYFMSGCPSGGSDATYWWCTANNVLVDYGGGVVYNRSTNATNAWYATIRVKSGAVFTTAVKFKPIYIDLTLLFGTTIANYISAIETATPGAGVAWFRKLFPKDYYAYDPGSLQSVNASSHDMTGFNQWDEEYQTGYWNILNGIHVNNTNEICSKNRIRVVPGAVYYFKRGGVGSSGDILFYDSQDVYIRGLSAKANSLFTIPENCTYMRFNAGNAYGKIYNNDICINISWDGERDGEYEPYDLHSYPLDSSVILRGIPKQDANNSLYYDGDIYESDGTVTRKYGIVDLGTLTWRHSQDGDFYTPNSLPNVKAPTGWHKPLNILCGKYTTQSSNSDALEGCVTMNLAGSVHIQDSNYSDAETFKTAMNGVMLVYELAAPTTETASGFSNPQIVNDFGTEEYVDYGVSQGTRDVAIPVGHETTYQANLRAKLEMAPDSPDGDGDYIVRQTDGENKYVPFLTDATLTLAGKPADAKATGERKADIEGSYDSMTVGNAKQLVSTIGIEDQVPYNFRTSGGSVDIGDREVDTVVGGTIAWNQLFDFIEGSAKWLTNGSVTQTWDNGAVTVSNGNTASAYLFQNYNHVSGHKYLYSFDASYTKGEGSSTSAQVIIYFGSTASGTTTNIIISETKSRYNGVITSNQTGDFTRITLRPNHVDNTLTVANFIFIDLTLMFGATIADYIYSLETATPGAGVAWFRKLFPKDYYAYDPGSLQSVQAASHDMTGFNQFNPENRYKFAYNNAAGGTLPSTAPVGCTITGENPIIINVTSAWSGATFYSEKLIPGQMYQPTGIFRVAAAGALRMTLYTVDKNWTVVRNLGNWTAEQTWGAQRSAITIAEGEDRIAMAIGAASATTVTITEFCCHIVWDGSRDGEYEPYELNSYPLDSDLTLMGIPKLDANNNLYNDGDTYESDGTVTRKTGFVLLNGSETWRQYGGRRFYVSISNFKAPTNTARANILAFGDFNIVPKSTVPSGEVTIKYMSSSDANTSAIIVNVNTETVEATAAYFAANPVYVVYEIADKSTEEADPFQNPQIVNDFGTEEYVDAAVAAGTRDVAIPVGHDTLYQANLVAKLEMAPDSPDGDGDYLVRQTGGTNEYVPFVKELPSMPSSNGTYTLKVTVSGGTPTLTWVADA